jgi:hypothetical protein
MMVPLFLFWYAGEAIHIMGDSEHPGVSGRFHGALDSAIAEFKNMGVWREEYDTQIADFNLLFDREVKYVQTQIADHAPAQKSQ